MFLVMSLSQPGNNRSEYFTRDFFLSPLWLEIGILQNRKFYGKFFLNFAIPILFDVNAFLLTAYINRSALGLC